MRRSHHTTIAIAAAALVAGLTTAGCSSTPATAPPPTTQQPTTKQPTGEPIGIGYLNNEGGAAFSVPELRIDAQVGADYVNKTLGGVNNRPIQLVPLGIGYVVLDRSIKLGQYDLLISGILLVVTAIANPSGIAGQTRATLAAAGRGIRSERWRWRLAATPNSQGA